MEDSVNLALRLADMCPCPNYFANGRERLSVEQVERYISSRIVRQLDALGACRRSRLWAAVLDVKSPQDMWLKCPRGDWMAWFMCSLSGEDATWLIHTYAHVLARCVQAGVTPVSSDEVMTALGDLDADRAPELSGLLCIDSDSPELFPDTLSYAVCQLADCLFADDVCHTWYAFDGFHIGGMAVTPVRHAEGQAFLSKSADFLREVISLKEVQEAWDIKMKALGME